VEGGQRQHLTADQGAHRGATPAVASGEIEEILGQLLTHREGCVKGREAKMPPGLRGG